MVTIWMIIYFLTLPPTLIVQIMQILQMLSDDVLPTWWSYRLEKPFAKTIELYGSRPRVISDLIFSILSYIIPARSIMLSMKLTGIYTGSHAICKNMISVQQK